MTEGRGAGAVDLAAALERLRTERPLAHCLTNAVAAPLTANVLLAVGASPTMSEDPAEFADIAQSAKALSVNIGMLTPPRAAVIDAAVDRAVAEGLPWALDPVGAAASRPRAAAAKRLAARRPSVIRANASETLSLMDAQRRGKGVDALDAPADAERAAKAIQAETQGAVAVTGPIDRIYGAGVSARVGGGHPLMAQVSGVGCALSAVAAAFLGAGSPPFEAALAACAALSAAGGEAGARAQGPGSFQPALIDALSALTPDALARRFAMEVQMKADG